MLVVRLQDILIGYCLFINTTKHSITYIKIGIDKENKPL